MTDRATLIAVARGEGTPQLVIRGGRVWSAFTREWLQGDVAISEGRIAGVGGEYPEAAETLDAGGRLLVPGLIDAHMHIESSKLLPAEFARAVLPRGTTAVVADPHEIANVLGVDGVRWMIEATEDIGLRVYFMAPSCVPASSFESPRDAFGVGEIEAVLEHPRALGVAELMDFPGVIGGDPDVLARLGAAGAAHVDGHAPGVMGSALDAYAAAGIRSDHEATTAEEMLAKRRRGLWVLIREASGARNLGAGIEHVLAHGVDFCALCTDDREPETLEEEGHVDAMCRAMVAAGVDAEDVLLAATLHGARTHGLHDLGAIAPGYHADLLLLDGELGDFRPETVIAGGRVVDAEAIVVPPVPARVRETMDLAPVSAEDLAIETDPGARVRVIGIVPEQLLTESLEEPANASGLAKLAVVERHHRTGRVGVGLVRGFELTEGAFASSVAHDAHNLVVCGVDDASMLACVERLADLGGGICVARGGEVVGELPLPVAGLLSDRPLGEVAARSRELTALLEAQGVTIPTPFMTLSFLALSVIPSLKLTDQGLIDVLGAKIVPLAV